MHNTCWDHLGVPPHCSHYCARKHNIMFKQDGGNQHMARTPCHYSQYPRSVWSSNFAQWLMHGSKTRTLWSTPNHYQPGPHQGGRSTTQIHIHNQYIRCIWTTTYNTGRRPQDALLISAQYICQPRSATRQLQQTVILADANDLCIPQADRSRSMGVPGWHLCIHKYNWTTRKSAWVHAQVPKRRTAIHKPQETQTICNPLQLPRTLLGWKQITRVSW